MLKLAPQKILEALPVGVQLIGLEGQIIYSNPAADQLLRRSDKSLKDRAKTWPERQIINEDGQPMATAEFPSSRALATQQLANGTIGVVDNNATTWIKVYAVPTTQDNLPVGVIASLVDVTAQMEAAQAKTELDRHKLDISRILPHEWRTPIAIAQGWLDMLVAGYLGSLTQEQLRAAIKARGGVRRLHVVVNRLTAVIQPLDVGVFNLPSTVREVLDSDELWAWTRKRPEGAAIENKSALLLPFVSDQNKVKVAVFELINNAIKFTRDDGQIVIDIRQSGPAVTITVADNGIGIDPSEHEKIFDYFYQVDSSDIRPYEGSGIGLAVVRELMEWLGGRVEVESELGQGSTFRLILPVYDE